MKTLLQRIKRSLVFRLCYRLVCWINYPTSRERMWGMYALGKTQGRKEALKELPITKVQPAPTKPTPARVPANLAPGTWTREWIAVQKSGVSVTASKVLRRIAPPLYDDAWLNSKPLRKVEQDDAEDTEHMSAITKLKIATRKLE